MQRRQHGRRKPPPLLLLPLPPDAGRGCPSTKDLGPSRPTAYQPEKCKKPLDPCPSDNKVITVS